MSVTSAPAMPAMPTPEPVPDVAAFRHAAVTIRALGDPTRLRILWHLGQARCDAATLAQRVGRTHSCVAHNLAALRSHRLVARDRRDRHHDYSLTPLGRAVLRRVGL